MREDSMLTNAMTYTSQILYSNQTETSLEKLMLQMFKSKSVLSYTNNISYILKFQIEKVNISFSKVSWWYLIELKDTTPLMIQI